MAFAIIHNPKQIREMRKACRIAAETLEKVSEIIEVGISTDEINTFVHEYTLANGAIPAPLNYGATRSRAGFPKSVCTSVNEVICHGIPGPYRLKDGDIINVDVTSIFPKRKGYHGDTSAMFFRSK